MIKRWQFELGKLSRGLYTPDVTAPQTIFHIKHMSKVELPRRTATTHDSDGQHVLRSVIQSISRPIEFDLRSTILSLLFLVLHIGKVTTSDVCIYLLE